MGKRGDRELVVDVVTSGASRAPGLRQWLESVAPAHARGRVTIALVPDARIRTLNRRFRRTDKATDVLSFPAEEPGQLGDVVLCPEVVGDEWRWPLAHGLLHLLGYDHGDEMEARERAYVG